MSSEKLSSEEAITLPFVSVVVPTYNEVNLLRESLPTLFEQDYPNFEIILVNDGSTDGTGAYAATLIENATVTFRLINQENAGVAAARNAGWQVAKGELVAFIDTGCHADKQWISDLVGAIGDAGGIGGKIILTREHSALTRYTRVSQQYRHRIRNGRVEYLIGANMAIRRQVLVDVNGFRNWGGVGGEDVDICYRIIHAGHQLVVTDDALIYHHDSATRITQFMKKYFNRGYANYYFSAAWFKMGHHNRMLPIEVLRRFVAVLLSPYLAATYASRSIWRDWPIYTLISMAEHLSFAMGLIYAFIRRDRYPGSNAD
jgi:glycosyltransferase involved in cell wall biosynthesis